MSQPTTEPDRTTEPPGVTTAWVGGVALSGIGIGLAVVALTLPWISVRAMPGSTPETLWVTSLAGQGPIFAVFLVLTAVAAAVGFAVGRRAVALLRLGAVMVGPAPAVTTLFVGLRPSTDTLRENVRALAVDQPRDMVVTPMGGLTLYALGLLLIGLGLAVAALNSSGRITLLATPGSAVPQRQVTAARWVALVVAVPLVVLSLTLAWFTVDTADGEMPAVVAGWRSVYRVGLIAALALLVATAVTAGGVRRVLRAAGLYVCGGQVAVLSINALLLWDPTGITTRISVELDHLALGPAYLAAIAAVPLLLVVLATIAPLPEPESSDEDPDEADEQAEASA